MLFALCCISKSVRMSAWATGAGMILPTSILGPMGMLPEPLDKHLESWRCHFWGLQSAAQHGYQSVTTERATVPHTLCNKQCTMKGVLLHGCVFWHHDGLPPACFQTHELGVWVAAKQHGLLLAWFQTNELGVWVFATQLHGYIYIYMYIYIYIYIYLY
jgi:hypothetical protein